MNQQQREASRSQPLVVSSSSFVYPSTNGYRTGPSTTQQAPMADMSLNSDSFTASSSPSSWAGCEAFTPPAMVSGDFGVPHQVPMIPSNTTFQNQVPNMSNSFPAGCTCRKVRLDPHLPNGSTLFYQNPTRPCGYHPMAHNGCYIYNKCSPYTIPDQNYGYQEAPMSNTWDPMPVSAPPIMGSVLGEMSSFEDFNSPTVLSDLASDTVDDIFRRILALDSAQRRALFSRIPWRTML